MSFICLALVCPSAYSQDMRGYLQSRPSTDSTIRGHQHNPRNGIFPNRNSKYPTEHRNSKSDFHKRQGKWQHHPIHPKKNPHREKGTRLYSWDRHWQKNSWRQWPVYWRGYDLRYKSVLEEPDSGERTQKIIEWEPSHSEMEKEPATKPEKTYAKPKIVTVNDTADTSSEIARSQSAESSIQIYDGEKSIKVSNKLQKKVHVTDAGVVEIFGAKEITDK